MKYYKSQLNYRDIGVQDRRVKIFPEDEKKMKTLKAQGLSYKKIAGIMNLTYANVYLHLNKEYYKKYKLKLKIYKKKYYEENRESILPKLKRYRERKKQILGNIDVSQYLTKKEPKLTVKRRIMNFMELGKIYTYKEIKQMLNKDYALFSSKIKELKEQGIVEIGGCIGHKTLKRIK